jgi:signal transduction histidine kinase
MTTPVSQNLRRNFDEILRRWEDRARKEVASSYGTTSLSLRDALRGHLEQLAVALDSSEERSTSQIAITTSHAEGIGKEHGRDRANTTGYSIEEVIFEYRILRQVIIQVLEKDAPLSVAEREIITDLIEQAVNDAAVEFSKTLRDLRDEYASTLTHDLRGPITAAKMGVELNMKNAARVTENLKRLDSMIQNLLDAGRIRAGESLSLKPIECDPVAIALEVVGEMTIVHGERFVLAIRTDIRAWLDADLYRRALENLLNNAVKYGDPVAPITVSFQLVEPLLKTIVHNSGNPISEVEKSTLFRRYRRLSTVANGATKGWGLGLTLVRGVAEAHGGTIEVQSSKAKGTSFILVLPKDCRQERSYAA